MESRAKQAVFFLVSILSLCVAADQQAVEVHTKLGSLRGQYVSVKGKETGVHAYLGVPFAKPPIGPALRLAAPQPVEGWEGVRDATKQPLMCVQYKKVAVDLLEHVGGLFQDLPDISEDCLYLNIYTPANRAADAKLPVMVWIHGGGFSLGSASMYDGSVMAAYQDVVVVLIQYRLGILGFLSTGDEHMSGNFGMLDQIQALRWIQEHIHSFGGDPDLVTVFGESAGGVSVSLMLLSPLSDGLFHRAIAQSGTAAMDALIVNDPLPTMQMVANTSGCSLESTETMANCMKNLDLDSILPLVEDVTLRFTINTDGHFLTETVSGLYARHEFLTIPFMTGVNNDEGGWLLPKYFSPPNWTEGIDSELFVNVISILYPDNKDAIFKELMSKEYIGDGEDRVKNRNGYTEMVGDLLFNVPAVKAANAHRDAGAPVYLYEFQHPPKFLADLRPSFVRSDHGDEIFIVLGSCLTTAYSPLVDKCSEEEIHLSKKLMSYWGNFARTGSPNGNGLPYWPKYEAEEKYLEIGLKEQVVAQHLKKERFIFLTQTIQEKIQTNGEKSEHNEL